MSSVLRQPQQLSRASRLALEVSRSSNILARRPASIPRPLFATTRTRHSSTSNSSKKDQQSDNVGKTPSKRSSPAKGMESLYSSSGPMSPGPQPPKQKQDGTSPTGNIPLNSSDEKHMNDVLNQIRKGMPKSMAAEVDRLLERIKKSGIPPEVIEAMHDIKVNGLTPARAAKVWRLTSSNARKQAEREMNEKDSQAKTEQKSSDKSSSSKSRDKKSGKNDDKPLATFNLDLSQLLLSAFVTYLMYRLVVPTENSREITWQEFKTTFLDKGLVEKLVVVNKNRVRAYLMREKVAQMYPESPAAQPGFYYNFSIGSVEAFERKVDQAQNELGIPSSERLPISYKDESSWGEVLMAFGPTLLFVGVIVYFSRRAGAGAGGTGGPGGIFGMGRSRAKKYNVEEGVKVKFADVAGMDEAKQEIMEFVSFLKEPGIYQKLGAKIPRGAILSGPPGTGKTLLAKATAGESGVPFFSVSGSEFVEMFVGVGPSRVRDLFANARKSTPCIIFIDEIDAIGKSRSKGGFSGGNDERESTLNQILTEMDGFNTTEQVVVLAGTNRPDILDKALMRPGRFDRHISIDRPTMDGRKQIFAVHLKNIVTSEDLEHIKGRLSALTPGFSGADIANCVNEAALIAARGKAESVTMTHFEQAIERVIGGLEKKSLVLSPDEKKTVAYHEAGHAICGWYFQYADPLLKVSIIPRGQGALGYAQYLPAGGGDAYLMTVRGLMDRMAMTLGGRVSEELHFDTVTSGASDDFKKVSAMATAMVTKWGMSNKIGYIYYPDASESQDAQLQKPFSEETAKEIDKEVKRIIDEAYKQCRDLLTEKKHEVGLVAEELLKKEVLTRDDLVRLLGNRPWEDKGEFSKHFGGGAIPTPERVPGAIGDSPPAPPTGTGDLPPPLGSGPEGSAAPSLFKKDTN